MQVHQLQPKTRRKSKKRVARGGSHGKTSGRGENGQKSRSGRTLRPELRDFIKKIPKKKGYAAEKITRNVVAINLDALASFIDGSVVSPWTLLAAGIISASQKSLPAVKILGEGNVSRKLLVENCSLSAQAREKILGAGGEIKL